MCQHRRYAGPARPGLNRHRRTIMLAVLFPVTIVPAWLNLARPAALELLLRCSRNAVLHKGQSGSTLQLAAATSGGFLQAARVILLYTLLIRS